MSDPELKRPRGRPQTRNKDNVLAVAINAYWQAEPADASRNAICKRAGLSKPSVCRAFGSEDGLARAALDTYAGQVLLDIFVILRAGHGLRDTLDALIDFASDDLRLDTGCLFYKMRAGKHRLGPQTRARVEDLDASVRGAFEAFLHARREAGDWAKGLSATVGAQYLGEQVALAITQRASGEGKARIRQMMTPALALSVFVAA